MYLRIYEDTFEQRYNGCAPRTLFSFSEFPCLQDKILTKPCRKRLQKTHIKYQPFS